jgi:hypothetical protein
MVKTSRAIALTVPVLVHHVTAMRDCMFIHGSGQLTTGAATPTDTESYWGADPGSMTSRTKNCQSHWFIHEDTVSRGWQDDGLISAVCAFLNGTYNTYIKPSGHDGAIRNRTIFTHSMGNLVLAQAFRSGKCSLDASSVWYSASAPWQGSRAANKVASICDGSSSSLEWLAEELHYCAKDGTPNRAYLSMTTDNPALAGLNAFAATQLSGAMCGNSDWGLTSKYSAAFEALSAIVDYGEDNDGMVGIASCSLPSTSYSLEFSDPYYIAAINHEDGTGAQGDGDLGESNRQPCQWYAARASRP